MTQFGGYLDTGRSFDAAASYKENTMSDTPMQQDIFGGESPMPTTPTEPALTIVPRRSGWVLVAGRKAGPKLWHAVVSGEFGTIVTACGTRGHVVRDDQPQIALCPDCAAVVND